MGEPISSAPKALRDVQRWLASLIVEPERLDDPGVRAEIEAVLATSPCERAVERLGAHTGGLPARIFEALREEHPALEHVIGSHAFHELAHRYLPCIPSGIYNLNDVGSALPEFLPQDDVGRSYAFAADLARLERAVRLAFHAREKPALDVSTLAGWTLDDWSVAMLEFQPSFAVVESAWPILDIWTARRTPVEEIDIAIEGRPQRALIYRRGYDVACEAIDGHEAWALEALRAGRTLGEVAEGLSERDGEPDDVALFFARWQAHGLVAGCRRAAGALR